MTKSALAVLVSMIILLSTGIATAADKAPLMTEQEKISYALGFNIGSNLKRDYDIDLNSFFKGVEESRTDKSTMSDEEMKTTISLFQQKMRQKQMAEMKLKAETNKADGAAYLAANKTKEGVITLESGLQYKILNKGEGASPKATDKVKCHYRGTTIDGKEFDSSHKRGEPATFGVNGVIKGWTEALQLMKPGSKWMLYIPSDLAYGDRGAGNAVPPGAALIFEVELISIEN